MNRRTLYALILSLPMLLVGCTDDLPSTPLAEEPVAVDAAESVHALSNVVSPHRVLSAVACGGAGNDCASSGPSIETAGVFAGPLFGLATAPNGDILVADASTGITPLGGAVEIELPGVSDIAPIGRGSMWAIQGLTGEPTTDTGQALYRVSKGKIRELVDLYAFEEANNPDGQAVDSNPFDVASLGGQAALVVDAGGNSLLEVDNRGGVEVVATFLNELVSTDNLKSLIGCPNPAPLCDLPPMIPAQSVPTSIAIGPNGDYYVGELKGFPAPTGASRIWKIPAGATEAECGVSADCEVVLGGFTSVIDLAFGPDGRLYVVELDEASWFAVELGSGVGGTINACDLDTGACEEIATGLPIPTAITFGKRGALWATQNALIPGLASVEEIH